MTDDLSKAEIEAMARAICVTDGDDWDDLGVYGKRQYLEGATAAHTAASRVREERGFVVAQEKYVNYELADLEARRGVQSSYCPQCNRYRTDWDCAEDNCPMAAASQQRTADNG